MARRLVLAVAGMVLLPNGIGLSAQTSGEVDVTPPIVTMISPAGGITTRKEEIAVRGRVTDDMSGIASATCNDQAAVVVKKSVRCSVPLLPGVNTVILQARDVAGNSASAAIQVTRRVRQATSITLTPWRRTLLVGETATLNLADDSGVRVTNARWKASNARVVSLSEDDPPVIKAVRPGRVTITAKKNSLSSAATIAVVTGTSLAPGTTRWSVPPTIGGSPLHANRVDETSPDLFLVEPGAAGDATVRGVNADGSVMWMQHSPGVPLMGDSFGSVIAGVLYDVNQGATLFRAFLRLGDAGGVPPWRYESAGMLLRPAQAPDGTLYARELTHAGVDSEGTDIWDNSVIVIDGRTGLLISRWPLPRDILAFESANDGLDMGGSLQCRSSRAESTPEALGPIVGSDGRGYLLLRRWITRAHGQCIPFNGHNYYARLQEVGVDLFAFSGTNGPVVNTLYARECSAGDTQSTICDQLPEIHQLLPDGVGGLLASWRRPLHHLESDLFLPQTYVTRIDARGLAIHMPVDPNFIIDLIGQAGTAYIRSELGTSAIDVESWTPKWTASVPGYLVAARPDGGAAAIDDSGDLHIVGGTGQVEESSPLGMSPSSAAQECDSWVGIKDGELTSVATEFQDATRWTVEVGNRSGQFAVRRPGMGIFLKSHDAVFTNTVAQHNSIRVVPVDQDWLMTQGSLLDTRATDAFGNRYFTLGAGRTDGSDTSLNCGGGNLTKGINRSGDVTAPVKALRKLPVAHVSEGAKIFSLLIHFDSYANDVPYWCLPGDPDSTTGLAYNSNSFAHGLLHAAGVPHEEREPKWPAPGWSLPLPAPYFRPR